MKSIYLQTLIQIKEILFNNNNNLKNGIFKFAFSYFEKSFYLNKKSISEIINTYLVKATKDSDNLHAFVRLHPDYLEKNLNNFKDLPLH